MRGFWAVVCVGGVALLGACRDQNAGPVEEEPGAATQPVGRTLTADQALRVESARMTLWPMPRFPANVVMGKGSIRYLGSDVSPEFAPSAGALTVTHYFEALKPIEEDWKLFVHYQAEMGGRLANVDHDPVEGLYPTSQWKVGEVVADRYQVSLPMLMGARIWPMIGFYRGEERMGVDVPRAQDDATRVEAFRMDSGTQGSVPIYRAPKRIGAIAIDGKLDDLGWQWVPSTGAFVRTNDGKPPKYFTEARITWDEKNLYVGFQAQDEDVWAKFDKDGDPIYQEEVVELFLDPTGDGQHYNELEVSPKNVHFEASFTGGSRKGMNTGWKSGMETAVQIQGTLNDPSDKDRGWTVEMRIPVATLSHVPHWPPLPTDRWRFNLYRLDWHTERKVNEGSAFAPVYAPDFHYLPRFGTLMFTR